MRITFLSPTINMGGGTRVMVIYAEQLIRLGHTVRIISPPLQPIPFARKLRACLTGKGWNGERPPSMSYLDGSPVQHHVLDRWRPIVDEDVPEGDVVIATW